MDLSGKKVLVTGSEGFIGSHLTEYLLEQGCKVKALVLYNSFNSWGWLETLPKEKKDQIEVVLGDIRDPHQMLDIVEGCEAIFHLAALIAIPFSYAAPQSYVATNVAGTLNMLQAAAKHKVKRFIHTSTSEVYGTALRVPMDENHPFQAQSPYSASKISADNMAMSYFYSFSTPLTILRPFNVFGPRQSDRAVIPTIIAQIMNNKEQLELGALTPTRDFTYVRDTARGFYEVACAEETIGHTLNLGSEFEISIQDLAHKIAGVMGRKIQLKSQDARMRPENSEVLRLYSDSSKVKAMTKWKPEYSGIEGFDKGLKLTLDWFSKPENLARYKADRYVV